ncbi:MAG: D-aminoacyl-tRNA deacylase [Desulfurella sp.]|jgi:D-tyrosyl-tRNA(Tyr) deacylase|uniref:D-aminoacyl-tRNA deacylase n=1 Tax=Desulfurella TaxID=33001 RepID=UPI0003E087D1|nr:MULTISPECIES: D-aminoacyl-tRNA deacylase [Desulfurella]AHF96740.1 D-tyrosyl-tRNA(Tyr) deacylase [Desulfurella acetivorans A63]PMP62861.1 MAG: D-tyrosyl-tRNA(Tyr) deacylase [Desulfurella multipotens]PMP87692.1 MAG: D-tyrosyl-tRNA(Tyr) deacylase [Desulfurella sp.]HEX13682.1 D-tyrosyl-tRNA(Tyr) deacylase [Desulfurella acetivorans]
MKCLLQRVSYAKLYIDNTLYSQITNGLLALVCFCKNDNKQNIDLMVKKIINLRIFEDSNKKFNLSLKEINGSIMLVSQFTLAADTKKGNRPSFFDAMEPQNASQLYNEMIEEFKKYNINTQTGIFGASMKIELLNDGPVTIMLEN